MNETKILSEFLHLEACKLICEYGRARTPSSMSQGGRTQYLVHESTMLSSHLSGIISAYVNPLLYMSRTVHGNKHDCVRPLIMHIDSLADQLTPNNKESLL